MTYYLGELVLLVALVVTSLQVLRMRGELKRMRTYHAEFDQAVGKTETALAAIQATLRDLHASGRTVADELGQRIDAGMRLVGELNRARAQAELAARSADRGLAASTKSRTAA